MKKSPKQLPEWPAGKPLPKFKNASEEDAFWGSHSFAEDMEAGGEQLVYERGATRKARKHVYPVRLDDREMAILQALAKRRRVPAATVLRQLIEANAPRR